MKNAIKKYWNKFTSLFKEAAKPSPLGLSLPFIIEISNSDVDNQKATPVVILGADRYLYESNQGNPVQIKIAYGFDDYFGGGEAGYRAFLSSTQHSPFICGRIRVESENQNHLSQTLIHTEHNPNGTTTITKITQFKKLNQFAHTVVETDTNLPIHGGTTIQLNHFGSEAANNKIKIYFYPAKQASLIHALLGNIASDSVVKFFESPITMLMSEVFLSGKKKWWQFWK